MKSRIAEDLRLAGNAKYYHAISYSSVEDIKQDVTGLIKTHGDKYSVEEYINLFEQADYWLETSIILSTSGKFKAAMAEIMAFDLGSFVKDEYLKGAQT